MKDSKPSWGPQYPSLAQRATKLGWDGKGSLWGLIAFVGVPQWFRDKYPCGGPSRDKDIELTCIEIAHRLDICEHVWEQGRNQRGLIRPALRRFRYWLARLIAPRGHWWVSLAPEKRNPRLGVQWEADWISKGGLVMTSECMAKRPEGQFRPWAYTWVALAAKVKTDAPAKKAKAKR